jgi:hypothetical protein
MRSTTLSLLNELQGIPSLQQIGRAHALPHQSVGSWPEALQLCHSENWDALQLMTKNRHAGVVNHLNWGRCQEWNGVCATLRPEIAKIVQGCFKGLSETHKVTNDLQGTVSWDMLGMLLEREFDDVTSPAFYLPFLFPIYQAGHFSMWLDWSQVGYKLVCQFKAIAERRNSNLLRLVIHISKLFLHQFRKPATVTNRIRVVAEISDNLHQALLGRSCPAVTGSSAQQSLASQAQH